MREGLTGGGGLFCRDGDVGGRRGRLDAIVGLVVVGAVGGLFGGGFEDVGNGRSDDGFFLKFFFFDVGGCGGGGDHRCRSNDSTPKHPDWLFFPLLASATKILRQVCHCSAAEV